MIGCSTVRWPLPLRPELVVMAPGGQGTGPDPGMPGAPARPPGWRRHGGRRPPRTRRTARSHRSATRRPCSAGPLRSCPAGLPRPAPRTGACGFAGRGRRARARTARTVPAGAAGRPGWPGISPACPRRGGGTPRRGRCIPRVQGRKLAHQLDDVSAAGEPVEQDPTGGHGVLGAGLFLAGISRR
jgi:hypothetical protein